MAHQEVQRRRKRKGIGGPKGFGTNTGKVGFHRTKRRTRRGLSSVNRKLGKE